MIIKNENKKPSKHINNNVTYDVDIQIEKPKKKMKLSPKKNFSKRDIGNSSIILSPSSSRTNFADACGMFPNTFSPITPILIARDCGKKMEPIDITKFGNSIKNIGKGTYGQVDLHIENQTGTEVVIKSAFGVHDENCEGKSCQCESHNLTGDVVREVSALCTLNPHPNIVKLIGVNYIESPTKVVLEKADDTLWGYIKQNKLGGDDILTKKVMYHIVRGFHWMKKVGIWHRDIKPQNILMMSDYRPVIADFGMARGQPFKWDNLTDLVYTIWWRPPEILMNQCLPNSYLNNNSQHRYDEKAEVWAIGMCMWDILSAQSKAAQKYLRSDDCSEELQLWKILRCFDNDDTEMDWKLGKEKTYNYLKKKSTSKTFKSSWKQIQTQIENVRTKIERKLDYNLDDQTWCIFKGMMNLSPEKRLNIDDILHHKYFDEVRSEIDSKYPVPVRRNEICEMNTTGILPENWQVICSWIWNVVVKYKVNYSVYFLAIHIMRCYLYLKKSTEKDIQLIGVASLNLAALYMGNEIELIEFTETITEDILESEHVARMEKSILSEVGNTLHIPTSWFKGLALHYSDINLAAFAEILACVECSPLSYSISSDKAAEIAWNLYHKVVDKKNIYLNNAETETLLFIKNFKDAVDSEPMYSLTTKYSFIF
jgi:serine/threonine protein kinase